MKPQTLAAHGARSIDPATGAVVPPLHLSTTFERDADGGYSRPFSYGRSDNPNRRALEELVGKMEHGETGLAFASGLGACSAIFQSLRSGDHVVMPTEIYHGVRTMVEEVWGPWGVERTYVPAHEPGAVAGAINGRTALVWLETPANPMLQVTDIRACCDAAHGAGAIVAVDNTFATPVLQNPIDHGADLVVHATTKWMGGHSDTVGGVIVCATDGERSQRLRRIQQFAGAVCPPFDAWLARRGCATLHQRIRHASAGAMSIAWFLESHPLVARVHYPGLESSPFHELAKTQMHFETGYGGVVSFEVMGGAQRAFDVAAKLRIFTRATSLGGVESLVEHRQSIEGPSTTTPPSLLRLSIGAEDVQDLIEDLGRALSA